ncbi:MAG: hypothetical protein UHO61_05405 [Acutalibacteraceae bacterium]|nr:hypothetical protein [Acutalibacteraceae bacterium]
MKRLLICFFTVCICFVLSGCSSFLNTENDRRFMVTALGFSGNENITVTAEIVTVNSESAKSEPTPQVLSHTANSIDEALSGISDSLSRPMLLEHCGVIVIDTALSAERFNEICDYCFRENKITLSVYMIASDNPKTLLDGEPISSVAVGYDIMGIIGQKSETEKLQFQNRYFEIESGREKGETVFSLPYFARNEYGVSINGLAIFQNDKFSHISEEPK